MRKGGLAMEEKMRIQGAEKSTDTIADKPADPRKHYAPPELAFLGSLTIRTQTSVEFTFE